MNVDAGFGPGLQVLERGWLSSNNVVLDDGEGATLIDSGHSAHAQQTVALLRRQLGERPLLRLVNTHLHSDHCGGNAAVQRAWGCPVFVPEPSLAAVQAWDEVALSYAPLGQHCERYTAQASIRAGQLLRIGERDWQVLAAPGHDPHALLLFDPGHGVLISGDALWENGFGVVFPELDGVAAFDEVAAVLRLIETLPVHRVVPGHGAPFADVAGALARARSRLAAYRADPPRHSRHAAKVLLKFHLLEVQRLHHAELRRWLSRTPCFSNIWLHLGRPEADLQAWGDRLLAELVEAGALARRGEWVHNG